VDCFRRHDSIRSSRGAELPEIPSELNDERLADPMRYVIASSAKRVLVMISDRGVKTISAIDCSSTVGGQWLVGTLTGPVNCFWSASRAVGQLVTGWIIRKYGLTDSGSYTEQGYRIALW
jgi:hypothetical protein